MTFEKCNFLHFRIYQPPQSIGQFKFQIFDGNIQIFLPRKSRNIFQQIDRNGFSPVTDFQPGINNFLNIFPLLVFFVHRCCCHATLLKFQVFLIAFPARSCLRRVVVAYGELLFRINIQFVEQFNGSPFQSEKTGIEISGKINHYRYGFLHRVHECFGLRTDAVALVCSEIDAVKKQG